MSALTGNSVGSSYQGLMKTADNAALNTNLKNIEDGLGNASPLSMATNYVQLQAPTIELIESTGGTNLMMIDPTQVYFEGNVDFTNATVTGIGGGGGTTLGLHNTTRGLQVNGPGGPGAPTTSRYMWRTTYIPDTYGTATFNIGAGSLYLTAMSFAEGEIMNNFGVHVRTAGDTVRGCIYKAQYNVNGNLEPGALEYDFGQIDTTTTGLKIITNANHTLGATVENTYFLGIHGDGATTTAILAVGTTNLSGPVTHMSMYATTAYRGMTFNSTVGASLPANVASYSWNATAAYPVYGVAR